MHPKKTSENRSASDTAVISLCGRFLTFIGRTMYIGRYGTANPLLNAFTFALNVPNVIFAVLGTALGTVMIPIYSSLLANEKRDEAKKFIDNIISISIVLLGFLVLAGVLAAPWISRLVEGGQFTDRGYLTFALRVLMPMMIFFGFGAIFQGLLQSHGIFRLPAFVSAPGGIILILYLVFLGDKLGVTGLIFATALGVLTQPLIMLPAVKRLGYRYKFTLDLKDKNIRAAARLCVPVLITVASYQLHFLFGHSMALRFNTTAIMDYAQQLVQVFILTLVYAIAMVYLPKLSGLWAKSDTQGYNESLKNALLFTFFLVLPAALGFFLMRFEIMALLLSRRDSQNAHSIELAGNLMGFYAIGVIATSFKEVADRAFYSGKNSKTPAFFGVCIMVTNIAATLLLIPAIGAYAMPVAYGIAAFVGGGGLIFALNKRTGFVSLYFVLEMGKIGLAASLMFLAAWLVRELSAHIPVLSLILPAIVGAAVYFGLAFMLKISVLRGVLR
ncbi:MAG: polysaccharide biosynthesis C-terminal domain-containing protein [Defluviitaleaceae bacterium]|nr:polysaccharide biosynthesis C-terminal domain-containing protein [Defluviitaleaceae bacterium]